MSSRLIQLATICGALLVASHVARAEIVQYTFQATVTATDGTLSDVAVGTDFSGTISFDSAKLNARQGPAFQLGAQSLLTASIGSHSVSQSVLAAVVNAGSISIVSLASPLIVDGASYQYGTIGLTLTGTTASPDTFPFPLGSELTAPSVSKSGLLLMCVTECSGSTADTVDFSINSVSAVPEPSSNTLFLLGFAPVLYTRRLRQFNTAPLRAAA